VAALLQRVPVAPAKVDGHGRGPKSYRYSAQLPLLRISLYRAWRRRRKSSRQLRRVRRLLGPRNRSAGSDRASDGEDTPLFWIFVVAFNLVGVVDLIVDYYHAVQVGLPAMAGQLGVAYAIPIIYVPILMITHVVALFFLLRPQPKTVRALAVETAS
jgi:hypothetical protein